jgi:hypothetical protein
VVVAHQLDRNAQLCSKALLLVAGQVHAVGTASECIAAYVEQGARVSRDDGPLTFRGPTLSPATAIPVGAEFSVAVTIERRLELAPMAVIGVRVRSLADNQVLFRTTTAR